MTITWVAGTGLADPSSPNRGTSQPVPYVGVPTGGEKRIAIISATATDSDNVTPGVWRDLSGEGWTLIRDEEGGLAFNGVSHLFYPHRIAAWFKILTGGESGSVVVGNASGSTFNSSVATMDVYETDAPNFAVPVAYFGAMPAGPHASGRSLAIDEAAALLTDDHVHVAFSGDRTTGSIAPTGASITQTGATFGAVSLRSTLRNSIGDDAFMLTASAAVTAGSTNIPTVGFTNATSLPNDGPQFVIRLREDATAPLNIVLTGIAAPSPAIGTGTTVQAGAVNLALTGIMTVVEFGEMVAEAGLGVQLTGIPAPSPAINPAMVIFREGEEPQQITLVGIPAPSPAVSPGMQVVQGVIYTDPPCAWPIIHCGEYPEGATPTMIEQKERAAIEILWARSGMRFGGCPVTIRPCQTCTGSSYEQWPVSFDAGWSGSYVPLLWGGGWYNVANCGCAGLHSCTPPQIELPTEAASVTSVVIDGVTLSPTAYRVDNSSLLVRQDGQGWPTTQDLSAPAGSAGSFEITYVPGPAVPVTGQIAAGALALEFVRACVGAPCRLPAGVQSLSRQGVEMTLISEDDTSWLTGVAEADAFLNTYNPGKLRSAPMVYSPDIMPARQTTWVAP